MFFIIRNVEKYGGFLLKGMKTYKKWKVIKNFIITFMPYILRKECPYFLRHKHIVICLLRERTSDKQMEGYFIDRL
jgi:hypothetical protein